MDDKEITIHNDRLNKKCGVLTFHRAANYGAVLQAYALVDSVKKLGCQCELIDYRSDYIEKYYNGWRYIFPKNWRRFLHFILHNGVIFPNVQQYFGFLERQNVLSKKTYKTTDALSDCQEEYSAFIVGSDQVWNYNLSDFDCTFFLDFCTDDKKKNSYAASIGMKTVPDSLYKDYCQLLSAFSHISVREKDSQGLVEKMTGKKVSVDIDPTLLLRKSDWERIKSTNEIKNNRGYVLLYMILEDPDAIELAQKIAKNYNLDVVYINDRWKKISGIVNRTKVLPEQFIQLFHDASFVVTNSFHGTAFAVNLERPFVSYLRKGKDSNSRISNLLQLLDLKSRIVFSIEEGIKISNINIDYDIVRLRLEYERSCSIENLKNMLGVVIDDKQE